MYDHKEAFVDNNVCRLARCDRVHAYRTFWIGRGRSVRILRIAWWVCWESCQGDRFVWVQGWVQTWNWSTLLSSSTGILWQWWELRQVPSSVTKYARQITTNLHWQGKGGHSRRSRCTTFCMGLWPSNESISSVVETLQPNLECLQGFLWIQGQHNSYWWSKWLRWTLAHQELCKVDAAWR